MKWALIALLLAGSPESDEARQARQAKAAERAARAAQAAHERDLNRLSDNGRIPVAYAEHVLAVRDKAIERAVFELEELKKTKTKKDAANSAIAGKIRKKTISVQRLKKARLDPLTEVPLLHPKRFGPGKVGELGSIRVMQVTDDGKLTVMLGYHRKNGEKVLQTPLGPQVVDRFVLDEYGPGTIEGFPVEDEKERENNALNGIYQVMEGGEKDFRLKWLGAIKKR